MSLVLKNVSKSFVGKKAVDNININYFDFNSNWF